MKKSRLLEIIREEISSALNEVGQSPEETKATNLAIAAEKAKIAASQKELADLQKSGVSEAEELEEDTLNERPFIDSAFDVTGTSPENLNQDSLQNAIDDAVKVLQQENPDADAKKLAGELQKVNSVKNLGPNSKLSSELKSALQKVADIIEKQGQIFGSPAKINDLMKLAKDPSQIDRLEKLKNKGYTFILGNAQAVTAIEKSLGLKPKNNDSLLADKSKAEKPTKEKSPKVKTEKSPKAKVATRTTGDDGFDTVTYSDEDDEDKEASKSAGSDETAKELGSTPEEKKVKFNQFLASVKKNKEDKAKIDGILKLAKDKFKFPKTMMDDLKRAADRDVEA